MSIHSLSINVLLLDCETKLVVYSTTCAAKPRTFVGSVFLQMLSGNICEHMDIYHGSLVT